MPSARAALAKRRAARRSSGREIQVHFRLKLPPNVTVSREFLDEVWEEWLMTGDTPKNIKVRVIEWREGAARTPAKLEEARMNLRSVFLGSKVTFKSEKEKIK